VDKRTVVVIERRHSAGGVGKGRMEMHYYR
jgi:hypothetical protein